MTVQNYEGETLAGRPHGHGAGIWKGRRYTGQWFNGRPHGHGTMAEGMVTVTGEWSWGMFGTDATVTRTVGIWVRARRFDKPWVPPKVVRMPWHEHTD